VDDNTQAAQAIAYVQSPGAIRERCQQLLRLADHDRLTHFRYHPERLPACAAYVAAVIRDTYPTLAIPLHSRWRHFNTGGVDRLQSLWQALATLEPQARARAAFDLVITSVLLDAGAGDAWGYHDVVTGQRLRRSEGLAVASLQMFLAGRFASCPQRPWQADAAGLQRLDEATLAAALQVTPHNPLVGLAGRAALLRRLGEVVARTPEYFGSTTPRPGNLYDFLCTQTRQDTLPAARILQAVLDSLGPIWPGRLSLAGVNLGDVWYHPQITGPGLTAGLVPFHKLSQWLTYSLIEPLQAAGITVTDHHDLTALAEYRNGGLLLDLEVLTPRYPDLLTRVHPLDSEVIIEWRALTVALLDALAPLVRQQLRCTPQKLTLGQLLEGGTWRAGRHIARARRPHGPPPLAVASDGTVF
jgi:hypothetical protein